MKSPPLPNKPPVVGAMAGDGLAAPAEFVVDDSAGLGGKPNSPLPMDVAGPLVAPEVVLSGWAKTKETV